MSFTKANRLMLFTEIIIMYFANNTKQKCAMQKGAYYRNVTTGGTYKNYH
jgi:hypothetical protein